MSSISIPFQIANNGKVMSNNDQKMSIEQRITDVLVTNKGERVMRPIYGAGAYDLLFEPVDELLYGEFRVDALNDLSLYVSGVSINDLRVSPANQFISDEFETGLDVLVQYKIGPFDRNTFNIAIGSANGLTQESSL